MHISDTSCMHTIVICKNNSYFLMVMFLIIVSLLMSFVLPWCCRLLLIRDRSSTSSCLHSIIQYCLHHPSHQFRHHKYAPSQLGVWVFYDNKWIQLLNHSIAMTIMYVLCMLVHMTWNIVICTYMKYIDQLKWSELGRLLLSCAVSKQNSINVLNVVLLFVMSSAWSWRKLPM